MKTRSKVFLLGLSISMSFPIVAQETPNSGSATQDTRTILLDGKIDPIFSKPAKYSPRVPCLNHAQVEVWVNTAGGSSEIVRTSQLFILPQPIIGVAEFRRNLEAFEAAEQATDAGQSPIRKLSIPLSIHLHSPQLFTEIAKGLTDATGTNIEPAQIGCIIPSLMEFFAKIDGSDQLILQSPKLSDYSMANEAATIALLTTVPAVVKGTLTGTLDQLRGFADSPEVKLSVYFGAFTAEMSQVVFAANQAYNGSVSERVFGKDIQRDIVRWHQSSGGGGFSLNLPIGGGGRRETEQSGNTAIVLDRLVSRDFLYDALAHHYVGSGLESWGELSPKMQAQVQSIADLFLHEQKQYTARILQVDEATSQVLIDEMENFKPVQVQQSDIEVIAETNAQDISSNETEFNYAQLFSGSEKRSHNAQHPSHITFKRKAGNRFVPTSVKLFLVSKSTFEAQLRKTVREWDSPRPESFTRSIPAIENADFEMLGHSGTMAPNIISLVDVNARLRAFQDEHFPIAQDLNGPGVRGRAAKVTANNVKVKVERDGRGTVTVVVGGIAALGENPGGSRAFTLQFQASGNTLEEVSVPVFNVTFTPQGLTRSFSQNAKHTFQLKKETVDAIYWGSQIRIKPE